MPVTITGRPQITDNNDTVLGKEDGRTLSNTVHSQYIGSFFSTELISDTLLADEIQGFL